VTSSNDVFQRAQDGKADIVISHYGKEGLEKFVLDGYGTWPKMVFSNQAAIIGPQNDPAKIKGLSSAVLAMQRIAEAEAPFIVNSIPGIEYLENLLWQSAGNPARSSWYLDPGIEKEEVVQLAEEKQGYFLWGAYPFLRHKNNHGSKLEILVSSDPLLQRLMSAIIVNPNKIRSVNSEGAERFLNYLLDPETQAKIAAFRTPGVQQQLWWPAGRDN
jgi:tungstate transport system substrate-binding protein